MFARCISRDSRAVLSRYSQAANSLEYRSILFPARYFDSRCSIIYNQQLVGYIIAIPNTCDTNPNKDNLKCALDSHVFMAHESLAMLSGSLRFYFSIGSSTFAVASDVPAKPSDRPSSKTKGNYERPFEPPTLRGARFRCRPARSSRRAGSAIGASPPRTDTPVAWMTSISRFARLGRPTTK